MPPKFREWFNTLMGGVLVGAFLCFGGAKSANASPSISCMKASSGQPSLFDAAFLGSPSSGYASGTWLLRGSGSYQHTATGSAYLLVADSLVERGTECPATTHTVSMLIGDYEMLMQGAAVNETLSNSVIALIAVFGFFVGYYIFGPRRRSIIEVAS